MIYQNKTLRGDDDWWVDDTCEFLKSSSVCNLSQLLLLLLLFALRNNALSVQTWSVTISYR